MICNNCWLDETILKGIQRPEIAVEMKSTHIRGHIHNIT